MTISDDYVRLPVSAILVAEGRQRTDLDLDEGFLSSIRARGIIMPLIVRRGDNLLIAGGRRLAAAKHLALPDVPVRFANEDLDDAIIAVIELEENIKRKELPWQDQARAISLLHGIYTRREEGWSQKATSEALAIGPIHTWLRVARALSSAEEAPKIAHATGMRAAYNICERIDQRQDDAVLESISTFAQEEWGGDGDFDDSVGSAVVDGANSAVENEELETKTISPAPADGPTGEGGEILRPTLSGPPSARAETPGTRASPPQGRGSGASRPRSDVLCLDFIEWARTYAGPRFNLIHCDFPYGKRVNSGEWGGKTAEGEFKYEDDPEIYWKLCSALCDNATRLFADTAHLLFWTSSEVSNLHRTIEFFREKDPLWRFQERALVWHKSDNVGITPDPLRGPRWTAETALMASRGDRPLVRPLASSYSAPTARSLHPSTKPEPVLRHFFGMFVDGTTRLLDPTCGAGSALRAAESLGASLVLGIERSNSFAETAQRALREFRSLRELSR